MKTTFKRFSIFLVSLLALLMVACGQKPETKTTKETTPSSLSEHKSTYVVSPEEKEYLNARFAPLFAINSETIGYVYAPGTMLDEPIVQTTDNATYLDKTFEGEQAPLFGAVFMDMDNSKDFSNKLTWLFGHARGSKVEDHRMFNDVNFYDNQEYFDNHKFVVIETPERKYYYEAAFLIIVPETTAFYRTSFNSDAEFKKQLTDVSKDATTKNANLKIDVKDRYLVLSTCREEDDTIRSNLYLRQIPDTELTEFLNQHGPNLTYQPTR